MATNKTEAKPQIIMLVTIELQSNFTVYTTRKTQLHSPGL